LVTEKTISKIASEEDWLHHVDPDAVRPVFHDRPEPPRIAVRFLVFVQPLLNGEGKGRWRLPNVPPISCVKLRMRKFIRVLHGILVPLGIFPC
jgi:hypothetical protein